MPRLADRLAARPWLHQLQQQSWQRLDLHHHQQDAHQWDGRVTAPTPSLVPGLQAASGQAAAVGSAGSLQPPPATSSTSKESSRSLPAFQLDGATGPSSGREQSARHTAESGDPAGIAPLVAAKPLLWTASLAAEFAAHTTTLRRLKENVGFLASRIAALQAGLDQWQAEQINRKLYYLSFLSMVFLPLSLITGCELRQSVGIPSNLALACSPAFVC